MSFLLHSDEHGWLQTWVHDYAPHQGVPSKPQGHTWSSARRDAYRFASRAVAEKLGIHDVAILEERDR